MVYIGFFYRLHINLSIEVCGFFNGGELWAKQTKSDF